MYYSKVRELKAEGFSKSAISRKLALSRNTVSEYLKRSPEEFDAFMYSLQERSKKLDPVKETILYWLKEHPDLSSAQIHDWLHEKIQLSNVSENTVRNYVNQLREVYHIPKVSSPRVYTAFQDPPMGKQCQVDFGERVLRDAENKKQRVHFIAFILSHSRYKYVSFLDRPFRTKDMIDAHEKAFLYFQGMPEEMVYDQDSILAVNENAGDIIYTSEFTKYKEYRAFKIYLCRKSDPQTKGRVEQVVKFVANNFLKNRVFTDITLLNEQAHQWLERTGNYKVHHNTKKRPKEVFLLEQKHLQTISTLFGYKNQLKESISRTVQKDNVIRFQSNRYSVPAGTYGMYPENKVYLEVTEKSELLIRSHEEGEILARHVIPKEKGKLVQIASHQKSSGTKTRRKREELVKLFEDRKSILSFMARLEERYPRHLFDQLKVIENTILHYPSVIDEALLEVQRLNFHSANDFRDLAQTLHRETTKTRGALLKSVDHKYAHLTASERSESYYVELLSGGKTDGFSN